MPIPTPFHPRTASLCKSHEWRNWAGYLSAVTYEPSHEREYFAIRNAAALIDVTPLFKFDISGPEALRLVDRLMTRNMQKLQIGQVAYTPWCDDAGKMIDDGTVTRLGEDHFRITANGPNLRWFQDAATGLAADIRDVSAELAVLSLQGPKAREILVRLLPHAPIAQLKFFRHLATALGGLPIEITRTGYTGDLGYELWMSPAAAEKIWDMVFETGKGYGLLPAGLAAMDIARIEAGFLLADVDYFSSRKAVIPSQYASPFEAGLGWAVKLDKESFVGKKALQQVKAAGPRWRFTGIEVAWSDLERLFAAADLPPQVTGRASREGVPLYKNGRQIGKATSRTFSPVLKKYIALVTIAAEHAAPGTEVEMEVTVEYERKRARARVVKPPFYDPAWKRA